MKELWLFGSLDTLNQGNGVQHQTEEDVEAVTNLLQKLVEQKGAEA